MKRTVSILCCFVLASVSAFALTPQQKKMSKIVDEALDYSAKQSMLMYESVKDLEGKAFPRSAKDGKLIVSTSKDWTSGFFPGQLWYLYENTGDESIREAAEVMTAKMAPEQYNTSSHDVGFMINCSYGNGYRVTGKEEYRKAIVNAGAALSTRFDPKVGCIRSWSRKTPDWQFIVIIDNMMNLELLTVASSLTGDDECYNIAKSHADMTMKNHFRPNGSSYHLVSYDSLSGKVDKKVTYQGIHDESSWSRGQSWGLYGYTMMYRQTGKKEYLDHAIKIGKYIMNHPNLPKDKIPYWDFDVDADSKTPRDASAAAVMASAFVELSTYAEGETAEGFRKLAEDMIVSLSSPRYRAKLGTNNNFIVKHCTGFFAKNSEVDAPLSYADYYYVEALMRYKRLLEGRHVVDVQTLFSENKDRAIWLSALDRVARPLLTNMSQGKLRANMPVESIAEDLDKRRLVTHLEALGRLIVGISPWLELGPDETPEGRLRAKYIDLAVKSITNGVDPESPDYLNFNQTRQPLVDAAFLAHGMLRAKTQLWDRLDKTTQERLVKEWKSSRVIKPSETNWLFFSAMVETALYEFTGEWEFDRVQYAFDRFKEEWYKGDGWYGDGKDFHLDYYNSFVIQPMMIQILDVMKKHNIEGAEFAELAIPRYARFAEQQERLISPEGTYPVVGRSLAYRFGAFQALSDVCYRHLLPARVDPAQARCGMTAVIKRQINATGTFDENGWLRVGFCGYQPHIGEGYISTGSLYLCAAGFVALGLPETDPFWSNPYAHWTSKKAWMGIDLEVDKALKQ